MPKNAVGSPFSLSLSSGIEKVRIRGGRGKGVQQYSVEKFLSNSAEKIVGETVIVSPIRVSKKFMFKRVMSRFFVEDFCLTVPRNFVSQPFRVSLISGIEKFYASEGYV